LAVVATDVGGNKEVITHGETGYLVPPSDPKALANSIIELLKDSNKRKKFGENAKKFVNLKFDKNKIIESYNRLYFELAQKFALKNELKILLELSQTKKYFRRFGITKAIYYAVFQVINYMTFCKIFYILILTKEKISVIAENSDISFRFLTFNDLNKFLNNKLYQLDKSSILSSFYRGDLCFGALKDGILINYRWFSNKETQISDELVFSFNSPTWYSYKAFTHPAHRGQRINSISLSKAFHELTKIGCKELSTVIESHNFSSLKSAEASGYHIIGKNFVFKYFNSKYLILPKKNVFNFCIIAKET
jgi:hypothetical protein